MRQTVLYLTSNPVHWGSLFICIPPNVSITIVSLLAPCLLPVQLKQPRVSEVTSNWIRKSNAFGKLGWFTDRRLRRKRPIKVQGDGVGNVMRAKNTHACCTDMFGYVSKLIKKLLAWQPPVAGLMMLVDLLCRLHFSAPFSLFSFNNCRHTLFQLGTYLRFLVHRHWNVLMPRYFPVEHIWGRSRAY